MKVTDTIGKSWDFYKKNYKKVLKPYLIFIVLYMILGVLMMIPMFALGFSGMDGLTILAIMLIIGIILNYFIALLSLALISSIYKIIKKQKYSFTTEMSKLKGQAGKLWIVLIISSIIFMSIMLLTMGPSYIRMIELSFSNPVFTGDIQQMNAYQTEFNSLMGSVFLGFGLILLLELILVICLFFLPLELAIKKETLMKSIKNSINKAKTHWLSIIGFILLWGVLIYIPMFIPCIGIFISMFITIPMALIAYIMYWENKK